MGYCVINIVFLTICICISRAFIAQFVSTWMVPYHSNLLGTTGSQASCVAQGFLSALFYSMSAFTNASLAVAYCLIVRRGWSDKSNSRNRLPFILTPIGAAVVVAVVPLFGQNYNYNGGYSCFISGDPPGCEFDPPTCNRGANARIMSLIAGVIPYVIAVLIIISAVLLLIHAVFVQEKRMDRYNRGTTGPSRKMTIETSWQGIFYIAAFVISWTPWFVFEIKEYFDKYINSVSYYIMLLIMPLHGVLNASIYFRPRYLAERGRNPTDSRMRSLMQVLNIKCCCNKCYCNSRKTKQGTGEKSPITSEPVPEQDAEIGRNEMKKVNTDSFEDDPPITTNTETAKDVEIENGEKGSTTLFPEVEES